MDPARPESRLGDSESVAAARKESPEYSAAQASSIRDLYLAGLGKLATDAIFVTDKMPSNFLRIGEIVAALPEAKIMSAMLVVTPFATASSE